MVARRDEQYILGLCDRVLGFKSLRQHRFDFLRGDKTKRGSEGPCLPIDAYYPELQLAIEYRERQHSEPVKFWDKKQTNSGTRGQQRKIYDQRRRVELPKHHIALVEFDFSEFARKANRRLIRDESSDVLVIREKLRQQLTTYRNGHEVAPRRGPSVTPEQLNRLARTRWDFATKYAERQLADLVPHIIENVERLQPSRAGRAGGVASGRARSTVERDDAIRNALASRSATHIALDDSLFAGRTSVKTERGEIQEKERVARLKIISRVSKSQRRE